MTRRRLQDVVLGVLLLLVVLAAVVVAFVRVYPDAARRLGLDLISRDPALARPLGVATGMVSDGFASVGERWDARVIRPAAGLFGEEATVTVPAIYEFPADSCLECHPDYMTRPLFSVVYMPHQTHRAEGIRCDRCHEAEGPGRDRVPLMSSCAGCHVVTGRENCGTCHPPGNVFHGSDLAGDRELGFECGVCHNEQKLSAGARAHRMPSFVDDPESCEQCHTSQGFCAGCHPAAHDPGYTRRHAADLAQARRAHTECWSCHDARWCAMACHARR